MNSASMNCASINCARLLVIAGLPLAAAAGAHAQPFEIESQTIDGGGGSSSGGAFELSGTIGQHDAGQTMTGGAFELTGGFWPGVGPGSGGRLCADQNGDGLVTPSDFNAWIINFNNGDPRADTNGDGLITPADFNGWIIAFNQGAAGPICDP